MTEVLPACVQVVAAAAMHVQVGQSGLVLLRNIHDACATWRAGVDEDHAMVRTAHTVVVRTAGRVLHWCPFYAVWLFVFYVLFFIFKVSADLAGGAYSAPRDLLAGFGGHFAAEEELGWEE